MRIRLYSVYLGSLAINVAAAWALGATQILSGEETSVSLRDPFFLELRQQYEPICTNIAAHIFYWLGQRIIPEPSLFFGRYEKALAMSLVPVFVAAYLARHVPQRTALLTAALLALMPGFFLFAPIATEYGLECASGMAALWLAGSRRPFLRWLTAPLASWTALTYGAGLAFVPAIVWELVASEPASNTGLRIRRTWLWLCGFAAPWAVPFVIWRNQPHLLMGGGTLSNVQTLVHHVGQLAWEASFRGGSYYYFAQFPALSQPFLALAALAGVVWFSWRREHLAIVIGWLGAVAIYLVSGREIGMRRGVPIVVFSVVLLGLAWPTLLAALRRFRANEALARGAVSLCFAICAFELAFTLTRFASGEWRVPLDFDFQVMPGKTMPETYQHLLAHPDAISDAYEPERAWTALHFLARDARQPSAFSKDAIAKQLQR